MSFRPKKNYHEHVISKLVLLVCENEILNTNETSLYDKKGMCEKSNCFIHTILLVIKYLY